MFFLNSVLLNLEVFTFGSYARANYSVSTKLKYRIFCSSINCRYNVFHCAAKSGLHEVIEELIRLLRSETLFRRLYPEDDQQTTKQRMAFLLGLYLNIPDKTKRGTCYEFKLSKLMDSIMAMYSPVGIVLKLKTDDFHISLPYPLVRTTELRKQRWI